MNFQPLSNKEEPIATNIVDAAYTVHKKFGSWTLRESLRSVAYVTNWSNGT